MIICPQCIGIPRHRVKGILQNAAEYITHCTACGENLWEVQCPYQMKAWWSFGKKVSCLYAKSDRYNPYRHTQRAGDAITNLPGSYCEYCGGNLRLLNEIVMRRPRPANPQMSATNAGPTPMWSWIDMDQRFPWEGPRNAAEALHDEGLQWPPPPLHSGLPANNQDTVTDVANHIIGLSGTTSFPLQLADPPQPVSAAMQVTSVGLWQTIDSHKARLKSLEEWAGKMEEKIKDLDNRLIVLGFAHKFAEESREKGEAVRQALLSERD